MRGHDERPRDETAGETLPPAAPDSGGFFEELVTAAAQAVVTTDADGRVVYANAAAAALFGYDRGDLQGCQFTDLVPERRRERYRDGLRGSGPESGDLALTGLTADGEELVLSATVFEHGEYVTGLVRETSGSEVAAESEAVEDATRSARDDAPGGTASSDSGDTTADDTGQTSPGDADRTSADHDSGRSAEEADSAESICDEQPLVDELLRVSPVALSVEDVANDQIRANERAVDLLGVSEDELDSPGPETPFTVFDADGNRLPREEYPVIRAYRTGEPVHNEEVIVEHPDGTRVWLSLNATPVYEDGAISYVVVAGEDITGLKESQQELERQRAELETELGEVFDRITDGFFALNTDWEFTYVNEAAESMIARGDESLVGKHVWKEYPEALGTAFETEYERAMETQESVAFEEYFEPLDIWFEVRAYPSETGLSVYFQDVTDRKSRQRELERYETIVEAIEDGIYTVAPDETLSMVNSAYAAMTGYDPEDIVGLPTDAIVAENDEVYDEIRALEAEIADGERTSATIEARLKTKDGDRVPVEATFVNRAVEGGHERIGVVRDVSDRKERERELERYETIVETIEDGIYTVNEDGEFTIVNNAYAEMTGYEPDELVGRDAGTLVADDVKERVRNLVTEMRSGARSAATVKAAVERKDGETFPAEATFVVHPTDDGHERIGVVRDVTDRKERQQQLEQYERVVETVTDGVYILDEDDRFVLLNDAFAAMTGRPCEDLLGAHAATVFGEEFDGISEKMTRLLDAGEIDAASVEEDLYTADGESVTVENRFKQFDLAAGRQGRVGVVRDITDRKERERKLKEQNERLDAFASMLAHELRNPLEIAQIYLNMAFDGDESALEQVDSALDRIEEMIDALLVVTRRGDGLDDVAPVDLNDAVGDWWDAEGTLVVDTDREVLADENRLRQLLENLFRNTEEHAGEKPTVRVGDLDEGFFVEDDGPGIPEEEREDVFEPGYSTSSVGIGFGLSVVHHLTEAHGWTVKITESETGGARFEFTDIDRPE